MIDSLFRNWKTAAGLTAGICLFTGAFFAEGGGYEELDYSNARPVAQQSSNAWSQEVVSQPVFRPAPAPVTGPVVLPLDSDDQEPVPEPELTIAEEPAAPPAPAPDAPAAQPQPAQASDQTGI